MFELASASATSFRKMKQSLLDLLSRTPGSNGSASTSIPAGGESNVHFRPGSGCKFSFRSLQNARVNAATSAIVTTAFGRVRTGLSPDVWTAYSKRIAAPVLNQDHRRAKGVVDTIVRVGTIVRVLATQNQ